MNLIGARRDEDGYLWVTGRVDDMLNVSGHLMSTAEVESVLTEHPDVSEAAVVSRPHPVKGECLYCFVTPNSGVHFTPKLSSELVKKGKFYKLINKNKILQNEIRKQQKSSFLIVSYIKYLLIYFKNLNKIILIF